MNQAKPKPGVPMPGCRQIALAWCFVAGLLIATLSAGATAQEGAETPAQSFQKFMDAVLSESMSREDKTAVFERYFDFETWLKTSEAERGEPYSEEERVKLKDGWMWLFRAEEFKQRFADRQVQIGKEATINREAGTAIVLMTMGEPGTEKNFEVRMTLSADGMWWRWHSIPQIASEPEPLTREERLKAIEGALARVAAERKKLDELEDALLREQAKLRADAAESGGGVELGTPTAVVKAAWTAIEKGDADALLDCHTTARVARVKLAELTLSVDRTRERLMSWEVLSPDVDAANPALATVRVRLSLRRTGEPDMRVISVRVVKVGQTWKIDEAP